MIHVPVAAARNIRNAAEGTIEIRLPGVYEGGIFMKTKLKKMLALVLAAVLMMGLAACGKEQSQLIGEAATREKKESDAENVMIDEEAIALAASVATSNMSSEEKNKAASMRQAAVTALDMCNQKRTAAGLGTLTWNNGLESAAMVRAQEIVGTWSHTRPNGSDWYTVNSSIMYGENLAKGYSSASDCVAAWMASPTHRENVLYADFRTCGIAIYEQGGAWYWAEEFGY